MAYTKEQFFKDVKKEARALKRNATASELKRLDFSTLNPTSFELCVYGQMTHNCKSIRAVKLISKCCPRFFVNSYNGPEYQIDGIKAVKAHVNGAKIKNLIEDRRHIGHFSAIEAYIILPQAKNKNLIAFLRDETKELVL